MNIDRRYLTVIITFFVTSVVIVGGVALWQYVTSFHKVAFTVQPASLSVDIFRVDTSIPENEEGKKVKSIQNGQRITLQKGSYYAVPTDKKYDTAHIAFSVEDKDTEVKIAPAFSADHLAMLFTQEQPAIRAAMLQKYPAIANDFTAETGKLYLDGTWYATRLIQHGADSQNGDIYSAVLHKTNGTWQFAATPQIALTAPENPGIPQSILDDLSEQ